MSILAAASSGSLRAQALFAAVCLAFAGLVAFGLWRWRPGRAEGFAERLGWRASVWPVVGVMGAGVFCWWTASSAFLVYKQTELVARMGPDAHLDMSMLSPRDMALLATVPPLIAFVVLVVGDAALQRMGGPDLVPGLRRLRRGLLPGLLGSACVVPLLFGLMVLIDWTYRWLNYEHPEEHELLHALGETRDDPLAVMSLIVGAAIVAPLFEELLFRAHLQTVLRRLFAWGAREVFGVGTPVTQEDPAGEAAGATRDLSAGPAVVMGEAAATGVTGSVPRAQVEPAMGAEAEVTGAEAGSAPVVLYASVAPTGDLRFPVWTTWAAILVTSALFASVHAMWTWPPIFVLSLCLGYAYERSNNVWVPILIHAAFNTVSTLMFLAGMSN
jgi:membrane protease YdiL (CAAX protease family)